MSRCQHMGSTLTNDAMLREHFPYISRGPAGEFIIPADRIEQFVHKVMDLADNQDHLELLKLYRQENHRPDPREIDD